MPIARCAECGLPSRKRGAYCEAVEPHGFPDSGVICGVPGCQNPALIWLTAWEAVEYRNGRRIFNLSGRSPKVRLVDLQPSIHPAGRGATIQSPRRLTIQQPRDETARPSTVSAVNRSSSRPQASSAAVPGTR